MQMRGGINHSSFFSLVYLIESCVEKIKICNKMLKNKEKD
jgi:hypothetical protein